jgi:Mlc titration factor MtfA (ptsG expression regulator)
VFGLKWRRRRRLQATPWPAEWRALVERELAYYRLLPEEDRRELEGLVQVFLQEKRFEGCGGLEITDTVRLLIAAQACLLLLHRPTEFFPTLRTILVYPDFYIVRESVEEEDGTVSEGDDERLGESWGHGTLVLSWKDVRRDARSIRDGWNVVLHEFAHQLDDEEGEADGAPALPDRAAREEWVRVLGAEYDALRERVERGRKPLIEEYAAESPAEFFAVVTELFFEKSVFLRDRFPEIYEQLRRYYRQDPALLVAPLRPPRRRR